MRNLFKKWLTRLVATSVLISVLLLIIVLNPILTYASRSDRGNYTIFHNKPVDPYLHLRMNEAIGLLAVSELYVAGHRSNICLNDGAHYPTLVSAIGGKAFARGFHDKVVLMGDANYSGNYIVLNGYKWNLTQLLAHEMVHCLQYRDRGLFRSNPLAGIPDWKWEGYPEYIARANNGESLSRDITHLLQTKKEYNNGWIYFADSTGTVISYYESWLLVRYCMDVKRMSYTAILEDTLAEGSVQKEMMHWYGQH